MLIKRLVRKAKASSLSAYKYTFVFLKMVAVALTVGLVGGFVGGLFHMAVNAATIFREGHKAIVWLMPIGGVLITLLYHLCKMDNDGGTNLIISSVRTKDHVPLRMAPLIFVSTVITHLVGGSAGREGAALQLGGSIGNTIGELFKIDKDDIGLVTMCGMSAVFSALFGTPLTACFFAMEVISVGVIYYAGLVPCMASALTAYGVSRLMGAEPTRFNIAGHVPKLSVESLLKVCGLAIIAAAVSIFFCVSMKATREFLAKYLKNPYIKAAVGGVVVALMTLALGNMDYNGAGMNIIVKAVEYGKANPYDFFLKILFTAITIGSGFKGGEIVPTLFIGSTLGCAAAPLLGLDASFGAAVGIAALFCSVVNCPAAAIFLSLEFFGSEGIVLIAAACCVSYMLSGYYGLYSSQKIIYSKLHTKYINRSTK